METLTEVDEQLKVFNELESEVRSYIRSFPTIFKKSQGYKMWDADGKEYIDFFCGAGALNYGHNHPQLKQRLLDYIVEDGLAHSLDMATLAKEEFLQRLNEVILKPRNLDYKIMFPGPTGTNTVESALKLARKVTGRENIISFTNAFHGMTLGSLAITGNQSKRDGAGLPLNNTVFMPYSNYMEDDVDSIDYLERFLEDSGSGVELPAAIILETVQGEGGINAASFEWLKKIEDLCRRWGILLIIDDVQAGVGRTGPFFSFEPAGIEPDIVCLSKSIGGYGLPFAVTLFKPEHDIWEPGEHNGTFRGNNLAFVTASEALTFWEDDTLEKNVQEKSDHVLDFLKQLTEKYPEIKGEVRGRGFMVGIASDVDGLAERICKAAFERGLIMETSGPKSEVAKLFPAINIDRDGLERGLDILDQSIASCVQDL